MRKLLLLATSFATLAAATALPAGAITPASFTLTAGALAITSPTSSVSLGTQGASNSSSTISGSIGVVTVSDERGGPTTWTASVIAKRVHSHGWPSRPGQQRQLFGWPDHGFRTCGRAAGGCTEPDRSITGRNRHEHRSQLR